MTATDNTILEGLLTSWFHLRQYLEQAAPQQCPTQR